MSAKLRARSTIADIRGALAQIAIPTIVPTGGTAAAADRPPPNRQHGQRQSTVQPPKRGHRQPWHRPVAVQLYYVSAGHKPAYLWDSGPLCGRAAHIRHVVDALQRRRLIAAALRTVRLHDDVLVVHPATLAALDLSAVHFVDVSRSSGRPRSLDAPAVRAQLVHEFKMVRAQICAGDEEEPEPDQSGSASVCVVHTDACVPTMFGVLVGYPICYWYDATDAAAAAGAENCLAGQALSVFQLWHDEDDDDDNDKAGIDGADAGDAGGSTLVYSMSCAERLLLCDPDADFAVDVGATARLELEQSTDAWFRRRAAESGLRFCVLRNQRPDRVVL